jgi:hypothetical protein
MGWDVTLTTDRDVTEADMDKIVTELPEGLRGHGGGKQTWGYSLAADVRLDTPREIRCSGSCTMSGHIAAGFCEAMARRLERMGCKVVIGEMSV